MDRGRIVQTGTPQDIVLRPADPRVEEFVQHMNPLTALTAAMVMRPLDPTAPRDDTLPVTGPDTDLQSLIRLRERSGRPVLVADAERVLGVCDTAEILRALSSSAGPRSP